LDTPIIVFGTWIGLKELMLLEYYRDAGEAKPNMYDNQGDTWFNEIRLPLRNEISNMNSCKMAYKKARWAYG
jgi:hypothetical protein